MLLESLKLHPRFPHLRLLLVSQSRSLWMHREAQGNQSEERGNVDRRLKRNETSFPRRRHMKRHPFMMMHTQLDWLQKLAGSYCV